MQALIIAWLFGSFLEGAAGFGTPAAVFHMASVLLWVSCTLPWGPELQNFTEHTVPYYEVGLRM
jgi:hypothetical protein